MSGGADKQNPLKPTLLPDGIRPPRSPWAWSPAGYAYPRRYPVLGAAHLLSCAMAAAKSNIKDIVRWGVCVCEREREKKSLASLKRPLPVRHHLNP